MAGVEGQRRQQRKDLRMEIRGQVATDRIGVVRRIEKADALFGQGRSELRLPAGCRILQHPGGSLAYRRQQRRDGHAVDRGSIDGARAQLPEERGDADHEELVEVRRRDREELDALQQWMGVVERLVEDALVEIEPAQLPVDV